MYGIFWVGIILIIVGFIALLGEVPEFAAICGILGFVGVTSGLLITYHQIEKANPGYVLEKNDKRIEVLLVKDKLIQYTDYTDTLVITRRNWVNMATGYSLVDVKDFELE